VKHKLVLATDSRDPSGLGEHMLTLGSCLSEHFDIVLACPKGVAGDRLLGRAARAGLAVKSLDPEAPKTFDQWLKANDISLLHVHAGIGWEGHALVRAGHRAGLPTVRTEHLPYVLTDPIQRAEHRAALRLIDRVIAVSASSADSYAGAGLDMRRFTSIPNGILDPKPARGHKETRAALGIPENAPMLLTVARFTAQKDHATLISSLPSLLERYPESRIVLVGTGPELETIENAASGFGDHVLFLGQRDDVPDLLAAADLFVLPSTFEGLPLVLLEAMALGLPIVASRIGGVLDALGPNHPFLVPSGDAEALAGAILSALDDPAGAQTAAEAARSRFAVQFTAPAMAERTRGVYEALIGARRGQLS
jgi:glycosyltransferase involved in cell wall biosynthesis